MLPKTPNKRVSYTSSGLTKPRKRPSCSLRCGLYQGRCRLGRYAMVRRLLIGITQLEQLGLAIGAAKEGDADRKIVRRKTGRHRYRRHKDEEGVERGYALLADVRWVDAVLDEGRLMLDRFVDNGVETIVGHHLQDGGHQLAAGFQIVAEFRGVRRL